MNTENNIPILRLSISPSIDCFKPKVVLKDVGNMECQEMTTLTDIAIIIYHLCGVGVTYNLAEELSKELNVDYEKTLDVLWKIIKKYKNMDYKTAHMKSFPDDVWIEEEKGENKKMDIIYPTRCIIVDVEGTKIGESDFIRKTPDVSKSYVGEKGMAIRMEDENVKITLDCGKVLMGYECWWTPIES